MISFKKAAAGILSIALLAGMFLPVNSRAEGQGQEEAAVATRSVSALSVETPDNGVLTYEYGTAQDFILQVTNRSSEAVANIVIAPKLRNGTDVWPFKTEYQSYKSVIDALQPGETKEVSFSFTERDDIATGTYSLCFQVTAQSAGGEELPPGEEYFFVNTTAKPEDPVTDPAFEPQEESGMEEELLEASAGGFANGDISYSGGGGGTSAASVPRVIVTGFSTNPAEVKAGSDFVLTIHLKNTSKSTRVSNMLFELAAPTEGKDEQTSAPAFLPTSGSNSIYLDGIQAGGTADISIQLNAKADLVQKPYGINLSMKYEDSSASQVEGEASISIPIKQEARFEFSEFEVTPEMIEVGEEGNVTCSLYNLGRIKLYNVKAVFEGKGIKKEEVFVGNVEPGGSASIDAMLEGTDVNADTDKIKMTLSYEDESGNVKTAEQEFQLMVTEAMEDSGGMVMMPDEQEKSFPVIPLVIAALVLLAIVVTVVVRKKKKKQILSAEEEGLLDELDGPSEDE